MAPSSTFKNEFVVCFVNHKRFHNRVLTREQTIQSQEISIRPSKLDECPKPSLSGSQDFKSPSLQLSFGAKIEGFMHREQPTADQATTNREQGNNHESNRHTNKEAIRRMPSIDRVQKLTSTDSVWPSEAWSRWSWIPSPHHRQRPFRGALFTRGRSGGRSEQKRRRRSRETMEMFVARYSFVLYDEAKVSYIYRWGTPFVLVLLHM